MELVNIVSSMVATLIDPSSCRLQTSFLSVNGCDDYPKSGKTELTINVKLVGYSIGLSKLMLVTNVVRPINGNDSCRPFGKTELVNIV